MYSYFQFPFKTPIKSKIKIRHLIISLLLKPEFPTEVNGILRNYFALILAVQNYSFKYSS